MINVYPRRSIREKGQGGFLVSTGSSSRVKTSSTIYSETRPKIVDFHRLLWKNVGSSMFHSRCNKLEEITLRVKTKELIFSSIIPTIIRCLDVSNDCAKILVKRFSSRHGSLDSPRGCLIEDLRCFLRQLILIFIFFFSWLYPLWRIFHGIELINSFHYRKLQMGKKSFVRIR